MLKYYNSIVQLLRKRAVMRKDVLESEVSLVSTDLRMAAGNGTNAWAHYLREMGRGEQKLSREVK